LFVRLYHFFFDLIPCVSKAPLFRTISIGGINAGGTGKTPLTLYVAEELDSMKLPVVIVSRGYGRAERKPIFIKSGSDLSWENVGDEPAMIYQRLPQVSLSIDKNRRRAIAVASKYLPPNTIAILDDGFQHRKCQRDIDILCLPDSVFADYPIPAGYLREPIAALKRADLFCLISHTADRSQWEENESTLLKMFPHTPIVKIKQEPLGWVELHSGKIKKKPPLSSPILVCGIARPERFIDFVHKSDITPMAQHIFNDHHRYSAADFSTLSHLKNIEIITTEKDAVKLKQLKLVNLRNIWYLRIGMCFNSTNDRDIFFATIKKKILIGGNS